MTLRVHGLPTALLALAAGLAVTAGLIFEQLRDMQVASRTAYGQAISFRLDGVRRVREAHLARLRAMK
ncbi:MAG: hypothetical protein FIB05_07160, partial [Betaproteobacteria bacterium]|nr:hypothetical protein [Betaproteobacteria bacterium]